jgi:sialic acid synthase SpsE
VTLDRAQRGPDHPFAMEMGPFKAYVAALKRQRPGREPAGGTFLEPSAREWQNRTLALKSVISRRALDAGHVLTAEDVYLARPGSGIEAAAWSRVLGRALKRAVAAETPLAWDDLSS